MRIKRRKLGLFAACAVAALGFLMLESVALGQEESAVGSPRIVVSPQSRPGPFGPGGRGGRGRPPGRRGDGRGMYGPGMGMGAGADMCGPAVDMREQMGQGADMYGPGMGAGMMGRGGPGLTEKQLKQARKILKKYYPEMAERLDKVGRTDRGGRRRTRSVDGPFPRRHRFMRKMWPKIAELIEADRKDPNYARDLATDHRLEQRINRMTERYDKAKDQQREELRDQVRELLVQQFEARQRIRTWRLEDLERQIRKLKEELESRAQQRQELIDRELERRLGQQEPLDW